MKKVNKTKKGFTLVELIAVIAILAILGAVLIPRIGGYQQKARKSNLQSSAKTIVNAIYAYNADKTGTASTADKIEDDDSVADAVALINDEVNTVVINTSGDAYDALKDLTVAKLVTVSTGNFPLDSSGNIDADNVDDGSIDD
jgi:prepilin-type N-terminal cleavage/methylation domain-containing protein